MTMPAVVRTADRTSALQECPPHWLPYDLQAGQIMNAVIAPNG
jgi:hypothetical protein